MAYLENIIYSYNLGKYSFEMRTIDAKYNLTMGEIQFYEGRNTIVR